MPDSQPRTDQTSPNASTNSPDQRRGHLVLVGNGDAHQHVAANAERLIPHGVRITLVTPDDFAYSDWLGGMLGGEWQYDEARLPASAITGHGGDHVRAEVLDVDRRQRRLTLSNGRQLDYDWLSLDLPPVLDEHAIPGFYSAKGIFTASAEDLWSLRQRLESELAGASANLPAIAVLGGGPSGVELAANLLALGERYGRRLPVTLIANESRLLPDACDRANRWLMQRLHRRGLRPELVTSATRYQHGQLILDDGSAIDADLLLVTDHLRASPKLKAFSLARDDHAHVAVDTLLRCQEDPRLFLARERPAGHVRSLAHRERSALLLESLDQVLSGTQRTPRQDSLQRWKALNLGDLRDIAWRGSLWCRGRWVRRWKHRRDRREVAHYLNGA